MRPLNPIMAALLAVSSAVAAPNHASKKAAQKPEENQLNILAGVVARNPDAALTAIGERLAAFLQNEYQGTPYLSDGVRATPEVMNGMLAAAKQWAKSAPDKAKVETLYFVAGPGGGLPAWAMPDLAHWKPEKELHDRLVGALARGEKRPPLSSPNDVGPFFDEAAQIAENIWITRHPKAKDELSNNIDQNQTDDSIPMGGVADGGAGNVPGGGTGNTGGNNGTPVPPRYTSTIPGFGLNSLYHDGAVVMPVMGPGDDGPRYISIKMYTSKDDNGGFVNKIGIVDISNDQAPTPPHFITLPVTGATSDTFAFKVPDGKGGVADGSRQYKFSVGDDGSIRLSRDVSTWNRWTHRPSAWVDLTIPGGSDQLTALRNDQISRCVRDQIPPPPAKGDMYYVYDQGGTTGSRLYFKVGGSLDTPTMMADIVQVGKSGGAAPVKGKPDLGTAADGKPYHLEFADNAWKVVAGAGDAPKSGDGGDGKSLVDDGDVQVKPEHEAALKSAVAAAKGKGFEEKKELNEFAKNTKKQVRVLVGKDGKALVLFNPSFGVADNQSDLKTDGGTPDKVFGAGRWIGVQRGKVTYYYTPQELADWVNQKKVEPAAFDPSNKMWPMQNVKSIDLAIQILKRHLDFKGDEKTLRDRAPKGDYTVSANAKMVHVLQGSETWEIWPNLGKHEDANIKKLPGAKLEGKGTVVLSGRGEAHFPEHLSIDRPGEISVREPLPGDDGHIALYRMIDTEHEGEAKGWYVMFDYTTHKESAQAGPFAVFDQRDRFPLPKIAGAQGLADVGLDAANARVEMLGGKDSGALIVYRSARGDANSSNIRDKESNCGGPILWWGSVTKEQAEKACKAGGSL